MLRPDSSRSQARRASRGAMKGATGSRRRLGDRCRAVAAPPTLGRPSTARATSPRPPTTRAATIAPSTLDAARAGRARALQPDRRPPRRVPDPARRRARRRRPRRQPRHRVPRGRRAAGRAARRDAARRAAAGRRPPPRRRGRRRVRAAVRHRVHRGRRPRPATPPSSTRPTLAAMLGAAADGARPARPLRGRRQDDPRHARAGGRRLRAELASDGGDPAAAYAAARPGRRARACARRAPLVARRGLALRLGDGRSATSIRAPSRACLLLRALGGAVDATVTDDREALAGADRRARARASPRVRRGPARGGRAVRPVPAQPADRVGRHARRTSARSVLARARPPGRRRRRRDLARARRTARARPLATSGATRPATGVRRRRSPTSTRPGLGGAPPGGRVVVLSDDAARDRCSPLAGRRTARSTTDGLRVAQLARHELAVAFAGRAAARGARAGAPRARPRSSTARPT